MVLAVPDFSVIRGGIPVELAAEVLGKEPEYIKQGIKEAWLPIGIYGIYGWRRGGVLYQLKAFIETYRLCISGQKGDDNYEYKNNLSKPIEKS